MQTTEEKRAYQRAHYHANKERWRAKRVRWEMKMRSLILSAKNKLCADCGGRWHPMVMEFDHLPGTEKELTLGLAHRKKWGVKKILAEIAKCEVVCPTCHRIRTYRRAGLID